MLSGLRRIANQIIRSGRVRNSLGVNLLSSLGNLSLTIAVARTEEIGTVGLYAVAFAMQTLAVGASRSAVPEPLIGQKPSFEQIRSAMGRASSIGLASIPVLAVLAIALGNPFLLVACIAVHGQVAYEYAKVVWIGTLRAREALLQEAAWTALTLGGVILVLTGAVSALAGFALWAIAGSALGYVAAKRLRLRLKPTWRQGPIPARASAAFGGDFLVGTGSGQIATTAVAVIAGNAVVGSLRAAGTLVSPASLFVTASRTLLIPFLARYRLGDKKRELSAALAAATAMGVGILPLVLFISFLPASIGHLVLSANWTHAAPLLPWLAVEAFFMTVTAVPYAGHKAALAARSSLTVRTVLALVRVAAILTAALMGGAMAVAITMAVVAGVGAIVWWASYVRLVQSREEGTP